jgi:hypothetical protein
MKKIIIFALCLISSLCFAADTTKITQLPIVTTPAITDIFPVVQSGTTKQETLSQALSFTVRPGAAQTAGYLLKWDTTENLATDAAKIGTMTDAKWCAYTTVGGLACTEDAPAGSGTVGGGTTSNNGELVVYDGTGGRI